MDTNPLLVELRWRTQASKHVERCLVGRQIPDAPASFTPILASIREGVRRSFTLQADGPLPERDQEEEILDMEPERFAGTMHHPTIRPRKGRFYPRLLVAGGRDPSPCRCIRADPERYAFDCTHPLSGHEVECAVSLRGGASGGLGSWKEVLNGPGMQVRHGETPTDFFSDDPFSRLDETEDSGFYASPRLVEHIDGRAREILKELHGRILRSGSSVLDLMSSHQSHLPEGLALGEVVGLGLNKAELEANPQLTARVLHDLNLRPALPFDGHSFDAVLCSLSVEYLTKPFAVFAEAARVLKPGGVFACTFSNRWFPKKVIRIWTELHEFERMGLVSEYLLHNGRFGELTTFSERGWPRRSDPNDRYFGRLAFADPIFGVWARKEGEYMD